MTPTQKDTEIVARTRPCDATIVALYTDRTRAQVETELDPETMRLMAMVFDARSSDFFESVDEQS